MIKFPRLEVEVKTQNDSGHWTPLITELEKEIRTSRKKSVKNLINPLPKKLHKRVAKIITMDDVTISDGQKSNDFIEPSEMFLKQKKDFPSTSTLLEIKIEPLPEKRQPFIDNNNWLSNFTRKTKRERIKWQSKIHKFDSFNTFFDKTMQLVDFAAEDFTDWVNSLASDETTHLRKDIVKELFSIGFPADATSGLRILPMELNNLGEPIANNWKRPELALDRKLKVLQEYDRKENAKGEKYIAFGKILPPKLQHRKSVDNVEPVVPIFPSDLKTKESLFKGIEHLKSSKAFVEYLESDSTGIDKPMYLMKMRECEMAASKRKSSSTLRDMILGKK